MFKLIKFELKKLLNLKRIVLILLIVFLSSFGLIKFSEYMYNINHNVKDGIIYYDTINQQLKVDNLKEQYNDNSTPNNLWLLKREEFLLEHYKYLNTLNFKNNDWRWIVSNKLAIISLDEIPLNMYLDGIDMKQFTTTSFGYTDLESVKHVLEENVAIKEEIKNILENGSYYSYIETLIEDEQRTLTSIESDIELLKKTAVLPNYTAVSRLHDLTRDKLIKEDTLKLYNYIVENKIEDQNNWRYTVIEEIKQYLYLQHYVLDSEEEFQYNPNKGINYLTYQDYLNSWTSEIEEAKEKNQKDWYYLNNNIKPLTLDSNVAVPYTTRLSMNNVYYMTIISLILTSIMCGGIVASEHKTGSIRLLLTKPFKRWKILLSKLLVTLFIFLFTYFIGIITIYLLSGIMYGFSDFSIPLLINNYGSIDTISYLTFTYNNILKTILIMILFLSILFSLSSITLNTVGSLSAVLILIFVLMFLPYVVTFNGLFTYIPLVLINFQEVLYPIRNGLTNIDVNLAIISSIIYTLIILITTFIIYCKRDIKN